MATRERLMTAEEFEKFCSLPENADRILELWDGEVIEMSPSADRSTMITNAIAYFVTHFVFEHDLGYMAGTEGGFRLDSHTVLAPDVAFIPKAQYTEVTDKFFQFAPTLAIEVVSPSDRLSAVKRKAQRYLSFGVREVWIIYPKDQVADVYRLDEKGEVAIRKVEKDGKLVGGDILPGFTLQLTKLFAVLPPTTPHESKPQTETKP